MLLLFNFIVPLVANLSPEHSRTMLWHKQNMKERSWLRPLGLGGFGRDPLVHSNPEKMCTVGFNWKYSKQQNIKYIGELFCDLEQTI